MAKQIRYTEPSDYFPKDIRDKCFGPGSQPADEEVSSCGGIKPTLIEPAPKPSKAKKSVSDCGGVQPIKLTEKPNEKAPKGVKKA